MLQDKQIIVTGAAGVLGKAVAQWVTDQGGRAIQLDVAYSFDTALGACYQVDLTDAEAVAKVVAEVVEKVGPINGLANIAGGFDMGPTVYETDDALWDGLFKINVTTLRVMLAAVTPVMVTQGRGSIVNVGALGALRGTPQMGAYTAAKSTVMRLTEAIADEVKHRGVNVNAVLPSLIDTPRNRADMPDADYATWVAPQDLAAVVGFLLSDHARAVHGALVPVSGLS